MLNKFYRSLFWVSGVESGQFPIAEEAGADIAIIDLEHNVSLQDKERARSNVLSFFKGQHNSPYGIRINSLRTIDGIRDIEAIVNSDLQPDVIILPKVESPEEIRIANQLLSEKTKLKFGALIESTRGFRAIYDIASADNNLEFLHLGPFDLTTDLGVGADWPGLTWARTLTVVAAAESGIYAIDSADFDVYEVEKLKASCSLARRLGFVGKSAMHSSQVSIINKAFDFSKVNSFLT